MFYPARGLLVLAACSAAAACASQPVEQPSRAGADRSVARQGSVSAGESARPVAGETASARPAPVNTPAQTARSEFKAWVDDFRRRARARGVDARALAGAFESVAFQPRVIELDRRQPEFTRTIWAYLDTAVSAARIAQGRDKLARYAQSARDMEVRYGVPREVIAAIWGMESNYGQNLGGYETIDALATLGYDGRRADFAEKQLYAALRILGAGDIDRERMRGSWAGAMGHTQFLPTSFLHYAVDADRDGRRDIWTSIPDVLASTANYLEQNGWVRGSPWGREVVLPQGFDYARATPDNRQSTSRWRALGVAAVDDRGLPRYDNASIIAPAGAHGPAFLVGPNFRVFLRYNNANSYALAVGLLSDRLTGEPGVQQDWPRTLASLSHADIEELQTRLNRLGYSAGTPDGLIGPNTRAGIRAFQKARGLTADGYPTYALLRKLRAAADS